MSKFEIIRTDINKTVLKPYEFHDEEAALGQYVSCLMLAGIIQMNKSQNPAEQIGEHQYKLVNGWKIQINKIN